MMSADDSGYGCLNKKTFQQSTEGGQRFCRNDFIFFVQHQLSLIDTRDKIVL